MEFKQIFDKLPEGFRVATEEDIPLVTLTLSQAFTDYVYPMPSTTIPYNARLRSFYNIFNLMVRNGLKEGVVFTNDDFTAVMVTVPFSKACPLPLDEWPDSLTKDNTKEDGDNLYTEFLKVDELDSKLKDFSDVVYIECFAVQTPKQGQKLGSKLMRQLFEQCKAAGKDIMLYTNTDRNRSIYEHFGFKCILEDKDRDINFDTYFMHYKTND